ncbi:hypothetical protein [Streptomyces sp. KL116D]|uniref:hypothetical protein n=1 Tax=Streptomyces sp. KL116D TaxID=3045152 RepID=UPI003557B80D
MFAYAFKLPPFKSQGEINSAEVCESLGSRTKSTAILRKVLPSRSSYSFDDSISGGHDTTGLSYRSTCQVTGDSNKILLNARTESLASESGASWLKWVKTTALSDGSVRSLTAFPAGAEAVASGNFAAIFIPCISEVENRSQQYNISLSVELGRPGGESTRSELIKLAKNAATFAHGKARCDMPLKLQDH